MSLSPPIESAPTARGVTAPPPVPDAAALARRREELRAAARRDLDLFREALREFAAQWIRETARRIAISQPEVTIGLGRERIAALKREVEAAIKGLDREIAREFTPERYADAQGASSGQVPPLLERRFEGGIRRVLALLYPIMKAAGYAPDDRWIEAEPADPARSRYRAPLELSPDIRELIGRIVEAIAEERVVDAKLAYCDRQRQKEAAARLWESS